MVVNTCEFRLVDQFYNVGTAIESPYGKNSSVIIYEQRLNKLIQVPSVTRPRRPVINLLKHQRENRERLNVVQ